MNDSDFRKVFAEALRKRLYPNAALHPDQFADALGSSGARVRNWLRGENSPDAQAIADTIRFFTMRGDFFILAELFPSVTPLVHRPKHETQAMEIVGMFADFIQTRQKEAQAA